MINVAVTGALGRMGSSIAKAVYNDSDLRLASVIEVPDRTGMDIGEEIGEGKIGLKLVSNKEFKKKKQDIDVLIDFTAPEATLGFARTCAENDIDMVIGTTGFSEKQEKELFESIEKGEISVVKSPNYSTGINVFWELVRKAFQSLDYDAEIVEVHHNNKKDAPSGTAKKTADIIKEVKGKGKFTYGREGITPREENEIGIHAVRAGDIIGDHTVYLSDNDSGERIEITHRAQSRKPFINGAIRAAKYVVNQEKGRYDMKDVMNL